MIKHRQQRHLGREYFPYKPQILATKRKKERNRFKCFDKKGQAPNFARKKWKLKTLTYPTTNYPGKHIRQENTHRSHKLLKKAS